MAIYYVDFINGNDSNDGLTYTNRVKSFMANALKSATGGDEIRIMEGDPIQLATDINGNSFTAQWTEFNRSITSSSTSIVAEINSCSAAWIASTNITSGTNVTRKEGSQSTSFAFNSSFTGGKIAFSNCKTNILTAYTGISFWIFSSNANSFSAINTFYIALCSDASGNNIKHSFYIQSPIKANTFLPFSISSGLSSITSTISSVAFYSITGSAGFLGTPTILIDNIIACKDVTLNSILSPTSNGDLFYAPQSITYSSTGTTIDIDTQINNNFTNNAGMNGVYFNKTNYLNSITSIIGNIYYTNPIALSSTQTISTTGTNNNSLVMYSFGWDRGTMTSQTGDTFLTVLTGDYKIISYITTRNTQYNLFYKLKIIRGSIDLGTNFTNNNVLSASEINGSVSIVGSSGHIVSNNYIYNNNGLTFGNIRLNRVNNCIIEDTVLFSGENNVANNPPLYIDDILNTTYNVVIKNNIILGGQYNMRITDIRNSIFDSITTGYNNINGQIGFSGRMIKNCFYNFFPIHNIYPNNRRNSIIISNSIFPAIVTGNKFKNFNYSTTSTNAFNLRKFFNNEFSDFSISCLSANSCILNFQSTVVNNIFYNISGYNAAVFIRNNSGGNEIGGANNKFYNMYISSSTSTTTLLTSIPQASDYYIDMKIKSLIYEPTGLFSTSSLFTAIESSSGFDGYISIDYANNKKRNILTSFVDNSNKIISESITSFTKSGTGYSILVSPGTPKEIYYTKEIPFTIYSQPFIIKSDNNPITIKVPIYRTSDSITAGIALESYQTMSGMTDSYSSTISSVTAWEDCSLTFTPTSTFEGRLKLFSWASNTSSTAYFDGQVSYT